MGIRTEVTVDHPRDEVFAWHARPGAIRRLMPAALGFTVLDEAASLRDGTAVLALPGGLRWLARHDPDAYQPGARFVDQVVRGRDPRSWPPASIRWRHTHTLTDVGDGTTRSIDHIDTPVPAAALRPGLIYRHRQLRDDLDAHRRARALADRPSAVAIADATSPADPAGLGSVAAMLAAYLSTGGVDPVAIDARTGVRHGRLPLGTSPTAAGDGAPVDGTTDAAATPDALVVLGDDADAIRHAVTTVLAPHRSDPDSSNLRTLVTVSPADVPPPRLSLTDSTPFAGLRHVHLAVGVVVAADTLGRPVADPGSPRGSAAAGTAGADQVWWIDIDDLLDAILLALCGPTLGTRIGAPADDRAPVIAAVAPEPLAVASYQQAITAARSPVDRARSAITATVRPFAGLQPIGRRLRGSTRPLRLTPPPPAATRLADTGHVFRRTSPTVAARHQAGHPVENEDEGTATAPA
ncbi:hypothetical protein GCM10009624_24110 [Gordonia sinesedis]